VSIRRAATRIVADLTLHRRVSDDRELDQCHVTDFDSLLELFESDKPLICSWAIGAMGTILEADPKEEYLQERYLKPIVMMTK
jgi:hypothetical protein